MLRHFVLLTAAAQLQAGVLTTPPAKPAEPTVLEEFMQPKITATYYHDFNMELHDGLGDLSINEIHLSAPVAPLAKSDTFLVLANIDYRLFIADINTDVIAGRFDLHSLRVPLQAAWMPADSKWFLFAILEPGLSTDFNSINKESFDLTASLDLGYQVSSDLVAAIGVYYSRNYGNNLVLPGVGLLWRPVPDFTLEISSNGFVPEWRFRDDWRLRCLFAPMGGRWTVEDHGTPETLRITGAKAGIELEHRLASQCWATVGVGTNVLQHLHVEDGHQNDLLDQEVEGSMYVSGTVTWRF